MQINNLVVRKSNSNILKIDNLFIDTSKSTVIFGENGAGKTTLVKSILGIEKFEGSISSSLSKNEIQVLMQKNNYPPYAKVKDIIKLVLNITDTSSLEDIFNIFDFKKLLNKKISVLSGGEL